jgi:hypothetical protein
MTKSITPRVIFLVRPRIAMLSHRCSALASSHDDFARQLHTADRRRHALRSRGLRRNSRLDPGKCRLQRRFFGVVERRL